MFIKPCFRLYIAFCFFVWNTCMEWVFDWCNTILLIEFNFNIIINNTIGLLQTPSTISTDITSKSIIKESPLFATFQMIKNHVFETLFECAIRLWAIEIKMMCLLQKWHHIHLESMLIKNWKRLLHSQLITLWRHLRI